MVRRIIRQFVRTSNYFCSHLLLIVVYLILMAITGTTTTVANAFQADFKPFVTVDLIEVYNQSGDYDNGEVLSINNEGMAVGWVDDGSTRMPFFFNPAEFDPIINGSLTILDVDGYEFVEATAISEPDGTSGEGDIVVVGYARVYYEDTVSYPCMWTITQTSYQTTPGDIYFFSGTEDPGIASGINIEPGTSGKVVGQVYDETNEQDVAYVYDIDGATISKLTPTDVGGANAIDDNGNIYGWYVDSGKTVACAWGYSAYARADVHTTANHYSQAYAVNSDTTDVVGWYWATSQSQGAAYWEYDEGTDWDGSWIGPPAMTFPPLNSGFDINSYGAVIISADDDSESDGAWLYYNTDTGITGKDDLNDLNDLVLFPPSDAPIMYRAYAINDGWWIGGSYKPDENEDDIRPVLLIPYDTDNDGDADIFEILDGTESDTNDNWLLDDSEDMRIGLHAPEDADNPEGNINDVYVVRHRVSIKARGSTPDEALEIDEWIDEIVDPSYCSSCSALVDWVSGWGYDKNCEIILRVQSIMNADVEDWGDYEALPANPSVHDDAIEDLQSFGYRFATCIDYLQWGNESFAGAGGYKFREDDLEGEGCDWTGDPKLFQNLASDDCKEEAVDKVLAWQEDQMWAALQGSALAGRPLRMCSTGMLETHVENGYDDDETTGYYIVSNTIDMCNRNQMYAALHVHYKTYQDAVDEIEMLTGTGSHQNEPWDLPNWTVATEVGTTADFNDGWWTANNRENLEEFLSYFFTGHGTPSDYYEDFVSDFISATGQYDETGGPQLDDVFNLLATTGFTAVCYSTLQYDIGTASQPSQFLIEALRGNKVRSTLMFYPGNRTNLYTPLKTEYETIADTYDLGTFTPHPCACATTETCPGCGQ